MKVRIRQSSWWLCCCCCGCAFLSFVTSTPATTPVANYIQLKLPVRTSDDEDDAPLPQPQPEPTPPSRTTPIGPTQTQASSAEDTFLEWCQEVYGITTILEIAYFPYWDYQRALEDTTDDDWVERATQYPMIPVRGLAASRDIQPGDLVIRIPYTALWTVAHTIDQDPVLSLYLGPTARLEHGWDDLDFFELPLLAVALLYHTNSPQHAAYIHILESTPVDALPFLWETPIAQDGIRQIANDIRHDLDDMYETLVQVLQTNAPDVFNELYSLDKFQWAFALVNSRHWHLPIPTDITDNDENRNDDDDDESEESEEEDDLSVQQPPASVPTDEWVQHMAAFSHHRNRTLKEEDNGVTLSSQSFLAPVADLLNFGPPCTQGHYNDETQSFDIVASCPFEKGQEVTFWYSNECEHVIYGNYGFTHPMVPKCPTLEDYRDERDWYQSRLRLVEEELENAYQDLDAMNNELERAYDLLQECDCDVVEDQEQRHFRGGRPPHSPKDYRMSDVSSRKKSTSPKEFGERHGIRRMWQGRRKSDRGL